MNGLVWVEHFPGIRDSNKNRNYSFDPGFLTAFWEMKTQAYATKDYVRNSTGSLVSLLLASGHFILAYYALRLIFAFGISQYKHSSSYVSLLTALSVLGTCCWSATACYRAIFHEEALFNTSRRRKILRTLFIHITLRLLLLPICYLSRPNHVPNLVVLDRASVICLFDGTWVCWCSIFQDVLLWLIWWRGASMSDRKLLAYGMPFVPAG